MSGRRRQGDSWTFYYPWLPQLYFLLTCAADLPFADFVAAVAACAPAAAAKVAEAAAAASAAAAAAAAAAAVPAAFAYGVAGLAC